MSARISIVTVTYNCNLDFRRTLESIGDQNYPHYELVVIDGGSSDNTLENLKGFNKPLKVISEPDDGIYDAMNKGIALAGGEWIIFLNAGDVFYSNNTLSEVSVSFDFSGDLLFGNVQLDNGIVKNQKLTYGYLLRYNICHQSMFIRKMWIQARRYKTRYKFIADNALLIEHYNSLSYKKIDCIVATYDTNGISSQSLNKKRIWYEKLICYLRADLGKMQKLLAIVFCFICFIRFRFFK